MKLFAIWHRLFHMLKKVLFCLLMINHIMINGVAASVHMTEDYQHEHAVEHSHFGASNKIVSHDEWNHDHDEGTHMHLEFQLADAQQYQFQHSKTVRFVDVERLFSSTAYSPPVPPPNH
jgi:hypothetical protein